MCTSLVLGWSDDLALDLACKATFFRTTYSYFLSVGNYMCSSESVIDRLLQHASFRAGVFGHLMEEAPGSMLPL